MRAKISVIILTVVLATMSGAVPALADDTTTLEKRAKLEALVDHHIAACSAKSEMLNSRSEAIRNAAIRSCRIANFCMTSREALIDEMLARNIEPKPYKVSRFLNEKFGDVVLAKE